MRQVIIRVYLKDLWFRTIDCNENNTLFDCYAGPFIKRGRVEGGLDKISKIINKSVVHGVPVLTTLRYTSNERNAAYAYLYSIHIPHRLV